MGLIGKSVPDGKTACLYGVADCRAPFPEILLRTPWPSSRPCAKTPKLEPFRPNEGRSQMFIFV
jgi:hypothetical protein